LIYLEEEVGVGNEFHALLESTFLVLVHRLMLPFLHIICMVKLSNHAAILGVILREIFY